MRRFERTTQVTIILLVTITMMVSAIGCLTPQGEIDMDATEQALRDYGPLAAGLLAQYLELQEFEVEARIREVQEVADTIVAIVTFAGTLTRKSDEDRRPEIETQSRNAGVAICLMKD